MTIDERIEFVRESLKLTPSLVLADHALALCDEVERLRGILAIVQKARDEGWYEDDPRWQSVDEAIDAGWRRRP